MTQQQDPDLKVFEAKSSLRHVFDELKRAIMMGEFAPGTKIRIDEYAKLFRTSHMPVREALNQLVIVGALEGQPRKSNAVPLFSAQRLHDLMDLRLAIEGRAVELATVNRTKADLRALRRLQERMAAILKDQDYSLRNYLQLNHQFHFRVYQIAGNDQLFDMIELAWLRYGPMLNLLGRDETASNTLHDGNDEHLKIVEALEAGDAAAAKLALQADLSGAADSILRASPMSA